MNVHTGSLVWKSGIIYCLTLAPEDLIRPYCVIDFLETLVAVVCRCLVPEYELLRAALAAAVGFFLQITCAFRVDCSQYMHDLL